MYTTGIFQISSISNTSCSGSLNTACYRNKKGALTILSRAHAEPSLCSLYKQCTCNILGKKTLSYHRRFWGSYEHDKPKTHTVSFSDWKRLPSFTSNTIAVVSTVIACSSGWLCGQENVDRLSMTEISCLHRYFNRLFPPSYFRCLSRDRPCIRPTSATLGPRELSTKKCT